MSGPSFAAIDLEIATPSWATACAIGVVLVDDGAVTDEHRFLIRPPDNEYGEFHAWLHGITPDDTAEAPDFPDVWGRVTNLIGERVAVAHNAAFDFGVVRQSAAYWGYACTELSFACTYRLAQRAWPNRRTYRLDALTADLGVALDHHDPLSDARAAAHVALRLCAHSGLTSLADLAEHVHYPLGRLVAARPLHRMSPPPRPRTRRPRQGDERARQGAVRGAPRSGRRRTGRRTPIEALDLSPRACNALRRSGLTTIGQVLERTREELLAIRNFGPKSYDELRRRLREMNYIDSSVPWPRPPRPVAMSALGRALREALRDVSDDDLLGADVRASSLPILPERYHAPIETLDLSVRAYNCLRRSGLMTVGQVLERTEDELLNIRNFGRKPYDELRDRLIEHRYIDGEADGLVIIPDYAGPVPIAPPPPATILDEDDDEEMSALGKALREALRDVGDDDLLGEDDEEEMSVLDMSALKKALREAHQGDAPIEALDLSPRACNALRRSGLTTVGQVLERTSEELLAIRNFGPGSYAEMHGRLREYGYIDGSAPWPRRPAAILDEDDDEEMSALGKALREALRDVGGDDLHGADDEE